MESESNCKNLPTLLSSFVDTFVDFCVTGGLFLPPEPSPPPLQTTFPTPHRLIAIGDLHGDLNKSKQSLRLAGLIDSTDRWSGGSTTLVQVGDVLDRGGQELKILYFLEKLKCQAAMAGGNIITMNGNHEIMNVDGDFRYVTPSGLHEFKNWAYWFSVGNRMKSLCDGLELDKDLYDGVPFSFPGVKHEYVDGFRARIAALRPNGPIARRFLSKNLTVVVVGENVFVHGGMLPRHVVYGLERINEEVRDWISGVKERVASSLVRGRNSLVWLRIFSNEVVKDCDCGTLEHVLSTIPGARRMIMGHTIQEQGINGVCENRALRIDVGMSKGCINGLPEVLEISDGSGVRILTSNPMNMYNNVDLLTAPVPVPIPVPEQVQVEA
ncbi:putative calcineurin-like phosphoesterase domain, ApaH type [Helianthus annuus]|nr:putative calcineurin-like phosphoesterase domain, ApaH type, metallo-dependent phosphatase [Helianthus annuus]KAJ0617282.1 putative calcineurin-like phosphoesterase domain, ApaH type [Helianthus annuus]KAJ0778741.1 putative calcineurin-like phosphoesterase domain, ApaH type, metallo-dependent phosphatase [Helianthus annuus]KAJ0941725.1 putative calcineurin-like phosphoesterase domain, ApaH type [Helianthus annuus]KAJ0953414.1 putative calcineurin-like phosphoesterase domain, ApaH type [Helia